MDQRNWDNIATKYGEVMNFITPGSDVDMSTLDQDTVYLSLPKKDIPNWAAEYVKTLETATLKDWCKCEWIIHPDDVNIQAMHCRNCNHPVNLHQDQTTRDDDKQFLLIPCKECDCEEYRDRRVRKGAESPECPIHSREGFILGFFLWCYRDKRK